ncbi:MAG: hypothetical protein ABJN03_19515 [Ascidiaceihabitans sp.]|uniref:hypothetical protein n=2 Tax=Alphaproteobacteria TaxID=28211 RepID=UPI0032998239
MIWISRLLRVGVLLACLAVLSGIVPISLSHFRTGNACPKLGPVPACYVVSLAYLAMAIAVSIGWHRFKWLFFIGATPVILLAIAGTTLELFGRPTCPRSDSGWPLCYTSLMIGGSLLALCLGAVLTERTATMRGATT